MQTILLNPLNWDLLIDANGNIAVADEPYRLAQDVACAIKTFQQDHWYAQNEGIPYYDAILGLNPPLSLVRDYIEKAALSVPGIVKALVVLDTFTDRNLTGRVFITDANGITNGVIF